MCVIVLDGNDVEQHKSMFCFFYGVFFFLRLFSYHDAKQVVDIDEAWEVSLCCVKLMSPTDA